MGVSFRGGNGSTETKKVRGGEPVCKFGVIAAWSEEGLGSANPQHSMGACLALFHTSQQESWGDKAGEGSALLGQSVRTVPPESMSAHLSTGLPLPTEKAVGTPQRRLDGRPEGLACLVSSRILVLGWPSAEGRMGFEAC